MNNMLVFLLFYNFGFKEFHSCTYASLSHNLRNCLSAIITGERFLRNITGLSREEPRWRRNRTGRSLSPPQIHGKNNWVQRNFTKLLIASWGHQAPRKAAHCLRKEVGQNIKDKKRDKRARDGDPSREGSLNRGSFQTPGNPRTGGSGGSFWISEGNLTGKGKINKTHRLRA